MEGPFLDPIKKGAHREEDIILPDVEFIREISGTTVSLGHTSTDYDTAKEAFEDGATHVTHLFNGMSSMNHREPGLIGAAAENENCFDCMRKAIQFEIAPEEAVAAATMNPAKSIGIFWEVGPLLPESGRM